jgi:hypothetical protein
MEIKTRNMKPAGYITHGGVIEIYTKSYTRNLTCDLGDLGIYGRIILKFILHK